MKYLLILLLLISNACFSQNFFAPIPKLALKPVTMHLVSTNPATLNAWRPIASIAAYGEPGNILMAGAGISYQHEQFDPNSQKWLTVWSVSGMAWAGGSVAPKTPSDIMSYGIMLGLDNNLLLIGPAINFGKSSSTFADKLMLVVSIGISLNN
jgi:hypothetical protein